MPRNMLFVVLAVAILGGAMSFLSSTPAEAQASCMHCRFQAAKCKRIGALSAEKCEEQRLSCVTKCKAVDASSGAGDKAKSSEKDVKPKKN